MVDYESLMREHDALTVLAARLVDAVEPDQSPPGPALAARDALSALLMQHLHTEDSAIYPRLIGGNDAAAAAAAQDVVAEFKDLIGDWIAYMADWPIARVEAEWPVFKTATLDLMRRLGGRVRRENELLYPLALAAAHIPLRAKPEC
ncbi:hemerythrin domain-containing protein [Sphingomonas alpina]|uniref:Hemerythrin domain-containing protein n=1 Tax=Sphingomonas alpina TaxID=653931 RepID=A0A7H0LI46_9SPHN|nr:hemerythrin domain-containing protein [Sphingomonas alpina]QNQ09349.1 hemerythrin domain-containing protein [Sphingomonas alpina]